MSLAQRITSKEWNVRLSAYDELIALFNDGSPEISKYGSFYPFSLVSYKMYHSILPEKDYCGSLPSCKGKGDGCIAGIHKQSELYINGTCEVKHAS